MEKTIRNSTYQIITGAVVGIALDSAFPRPTTINNLGSALQTFIEVGVQIGLDIGIAQSFGTTFKFSFGGTSMIDSIPFMISIMGFQPNLGDKMMELKRFMHQYWEGMTLVQTIKPTGELGGDSATNEPSSSAEAPLSIRSDPNPQSADTTFPYGTVPHYFG